MWLLSNPTVRGCCMISCILQIVGSSASLCMVMQYLEECQDVASFVFYGSLTVVSPYRVSQYLIQCTDVAFFMFVLQIIDSSASLYMVMQYPKECPDVAYFVSHRLLTVPHHRTWSRSTPRSARMTWTPPMLPRLAPSWPWLSLVSDFLLKVEFRALGSQEVSSLCFIMQTTVSALAHERNYDYEKLPTTLTFSNVLMTFVTCLTMCSTTTSWFDWLSSDFDW